MSVGQPPSDVQYLTATDHPALNSTGVGRRLRFVDLFAGLGGFHRALASLGHVSVYASEIDHELRTLYGESFPDCSRLAGDIRTPEAKAQIPEHDILCAGFPCQPFSKSGSQDGFEDATRGTLFHEILDILRRHRPEYLILENVGNFERHDKRNTWRVVRGALQQLGYEIRATTHKRSGGPGLVSPHHLGLPHTRGRFFIVGRYYKAGTLPQAPFPDTTNLPSTSLGLIVQHPEELDERDRRETQISEKHRRCIEHWQVFLQSIPVTVKLPSFPIWGDELWQKYPFEKATPYATDPSELREFLGLLADDPRQWPELACLLPSYAREEVAQFPAWKRAFLRQNREWLRHVRHWLTDEWVEQLKQLPPSHRKLEWNCQGEERDLWGGVLQLRPSGLRVKRYTACPALVAMTDTQIPILGPERRHLTRVEGLRLQGFPDDHPLPKNRAAAFAALGNAVHVQVVTEIAARLLGHRHLDLASHAPQRDAVHQLPLLVAEHPPAACTIHVPLPVGPLSTTQPVAH